MPSHQPGMAHFAGTGPQNETCGTCDHRAPTERRCAVYTRLTGARGAQIPSRTEACRYWERATDTREPLYDFGGAR